MPRMRNEPAGEIAMVEHLEFFDLIERLPPAARPHLLMEEKERLERQLAKVKELLEGTPVTEETK